MAAIAQVRGAGRPKQAILLGLLLGGFVMLALNLPGQMSYDSVSQLYQGRTGFYNSWHPPVMAWLLGLFDRLWPGPALFVLFDAALLLGAWGLLLQRGQRVDWRAGLVLLAICLTPQFLLYQGTVWKDILFANAAVAAFVALALMAADGNKFWLAAFAPLLVLAALARQNGIVLAPAGAVALGWIVAQRQGPRRGIAWGAAMLGLLLVLAGGATMALALRGDDGDGASAELRTAQVYDMIGALAAAPNLALPQLAAQDPVLSKAMRGDGVRLYSPRGADRLSLSPSLTAAIFDAPDGLIFAQWQAMVRSHPDLYLATRWPVFLWVVATPDLSACHPAFAGVEGAPDLLRTLGLTPHIRAQDRLLAGYTRAFMGTPVLSHLVFLALALVLLAALLWRRRPADLAMAAMLGGALVFTASFFVVSLACDYRYLYFLDLSAMTAGLYWVIDFGSLCTKPYKN
jgi:hypothetical protein